MCGIVGVVNLDGRPVAPDLIRRMNDRIAHRGPDDEGYFAGDNVALGMRRLSIIDVAGGRQPISDESGNVVAVFNGEIYNFQSLRERLLQRGHRFATRTDTEVIPHLYEDKGNEFLQDLLGMFAIALWNRRDRTLLLARDRLGIKPLYYTHRNGQLIFGSELKSIEAVCDVSGDISPEAVTLYMNYGYVPAPLTIYQGVYKLPPGHLLTTSAHNVTIERYWDIDYDHTAGDDEDALADELHDLLLDAVRQRLVSDVPIGAFLSGGIDSSLVVALMCQCASEVRTFSIGFEERAYDESSYARAVATRLGTRHEEFIVRPDIGAMLEPIVLQFDEPFADASAIPTYFLSRLTRQHVTVALSGDGGDELFAGYHRYRDYFRKRPLYRLPRFLRRSTFGLLGRLLPGGVKGKRFCKTLELEPLEDYVVGNYGVEPGCLLAPEVREAVPEGYLLAFAKPYTDREVPTELDALCHHDLKLYLPDDILTKVDRMSMAVSLEVRVPILDHRVVEFAAHLPDSLRLRGKQGKYLLRRVLERYLPGELFERPKQGFGIPLGQWFRQELREQVHDLTSAQALSRGGVLDPKATEVVLQRHLSGQRDYSGLLWRILTLQIWLQHRSDPQRRFQLTNARADGGEGCQPKFGG